MELPKPDDKIVPESVIFMLLGIFWREQTLPIELGCNIKIEDNNYSAIYGVMLSKNGVKITEMQLDAPDLIIHTNLEVILRLSSQQLTMQSALNNQVTVEGSSEHIQHLLNWVTKTQSV